MATKGGGRTGPAPRAKRQRPKRSGGWRKPAILFRDVKRAVPDCGWDQDGRATENSRRTPLPGRAACRIVALSRRPWARPSPTQQEAHLIDSDANRRRARPVTRSGRRVTSSMKRATSSGASCTRKAARSASMPNRRRSSLKSPSLRRQRDRLDPGRVARGRTVRPSRHRRPDRCRGRHRADAASPGTGWRRGARPRVPPPSAWSA